MPNATNILVIPPLAASKPPGTSRKSHGPHSWHHTRGTWSVTPHDPYMSPARAAARRGQTPKAIASPPTICATPVKYAQNSGAGYHGGTREAVPSP